MTQSGKKLIHEAAHAVVSKLQAGGVVVHCAGGTGRTGTVIGCARYDSCCVRAGDHLPRSPASGPWQVGLA